MNRDKLWREKKERKKKKKVVLQSIILIFIAIIFVNKLFFSEDYIPYEELDLPISENKEEGFIALSYFGVDREGNETIISTMKLEKQIKALKDNGYATITQEDIIDYYKNGKLLPKKALFIMFEDGRRDTAIYSGEILKKYNYISTILTYAEKFKYKDPKFLSGKDIKKFEETTFFELGTNGYRLKYINVFDKNQNYLGIMESEEFIKRKDKIDTDYNHYLMDYIRDEDGIPLESYNKLKNRIDFDYENLKTEYTNNLGQVPKLYSLMHANTGAFGTNKNASNINEGWIKELFVINFNREGYSLNEHTSSIYDLTRLQPQSYWKTNHLLMRIWDDTKEEVNFVKGKSKKSSEFEMIKGAVEFEGESIYLTSLPKEEGLLKLEKELSSENFNISVDLKGNIIGNQSIYLKADEDRGNSIKVSYENDYIILTDIKNGEEEIIESYFIGEDDNKIIDISDKREINLNVSLEKEKFIIKVNGKDIIEAEIDSSNKGNNIFLSSKWGGDGYIKKSIYDDVYDAIFDKLVIYDLKEEEEYINMNLKGFEKLGYEAKNKTNKVINWFINTL